MKDKMQIGILFCGGCNCYFDREEVYEALKRQYADVCEFFICSPEQTTETDFIILINGCTSECLLKETCTPKRLVIHNLNYQNACSLFGELVYSSHPIQNNKNRGEK